MVLTPGEGTGTCSCLVHPFPIEFSVETDSERPARWGVLAGNFDVFRCIRSSEGRTERGGRGTANFCASCVVGTDM